MTTEELEQIRKIIREETVSKDELKEALQSTEERLTKKIADSQEDTIKTLSDLIETGYNMHEERIKNLEDQAEQPHKN